jgi:hypothetical protein
MAKSKRSNSPKRSRRGGKRSPKKSKQGVQKKILKNEAEPAFETHEVEDPNLECELENDVAEQKELPKRLSEVSVGDVSNTKDNLVQFFWESLEEETHASLKLLTQLEESRFYFGTVAAAFAKTGKFTNEVESNLAAVWKADEAWIRSFLAGEIEPAKPEEPEAPVEEEPVEPAEIVAEVEAEEPTMEVEAAEVAAEAPAAEVEEPVEVATEEKPEAMEDVVEETVVVEAEQPTVAAEGIFVPESAEPVAFDKENSDNVIAEAVKTVSAKLGEQQSASPVAPFEGLAPKDLNIGQPLNLA